MSAPERFSRALEALAEDGERIPCQGRDRDLWTSDSPRDRARASGACSPCPLLTLCSETAAENGDKFGVWGGKDISPRPKGRPRSKEPVEISNGALVTLYHFTSYEALTSIVDDGEIRPSGKSLDRVGDDFWPAHDAPDIVWLTTDPRPGWCCDRSYGGDKPFVVRFTLRLPVNEVEDLWSWATRHRVYPDHLDPSATARQGEGRHYRCIERPVMAHTEWVAIDDMHEQSVCHRAHLDTHEFRASYAEHIASQPSLSPLEMVDRLEFLAALVHAVRDEVRGQSAGLVDHPPS